MGPFCQLSRSLKCLQNCAPPRARGFGTWKGPVVGGGPVGGAPVGVGPVGELPNSIVCNVAGHLELNACLHIMPIKGDVCAARLGMLGPQASGFGWVVSGWCLGIWLADYAKLPRLWCPGMWLGHFVDPPKWACITAELLQLKPKLHQFRAKNLANSSLYSQ